MLFCFSCDFWRLVIRGGNTDSAVLCTSNETFEMKEAETSNSMLILPQCSLTSEQLEKTNQPSAVCQQVVYQLCCSKVVTSAASTCNKFTFIAYAWVCKCSLLSWHWHALISDVIFRLLHWNTIIWNCGGLSLIWNDWKNFLKKLLIPVIDMKQKNLDTR